MNLIFVTRKIDRGDFLTSFVFGWIAALAKNLDRLYVICQEKGDTAGLPGNVEVYSFGKDKGYGRLKQAYSLWRLAFRLGRKTDGFFVHMHPVYLITAWLPAKLLGKKIILWYMHKSVDFKLRVAHALADRILTASRESFRLPSSKVTIIGHGIDLQKFFPDSRLPSPDFRIISVGRVSPSKDYETLIKAIEILVNERGVKDLKVHIYGNAGLPEQQVYLDSLVEFMENAGLDDVIDFQAGVANEFVPGLINESDLFVNMSATGALDKAVLEAAACEKPVLTSNEAFEEPLKKISADLFFHRDHPEELAEKIMRIKAMSQSEREELGRRLRSWVAKDHNLQNLAKRIVTSYKPHYIKERL